MECLTNFKNINFKFKRYSQLGFPPYRYIPELNPHPTEDSKGHSFNRKENVPERLTVNNWFYHEIYLCGVDLYNHAYWWESHESWESLWKKEEKGRLTSEFLQGLIKISAALIKWNLKSKRGLTILYNSAIQHLQKVSSEHKTYMGIFLPRHIRKLEKHFKPVLKDFVIWPDPLKDYPFLILIKKDKS